MSKLSAAEPVIDSIHDMANFPLIWSPSYVIIDVSMYKYLLRHNEHTFHMSK